MTTFKPAITLDLLNAFGTFQSFGMLDGQIWMDYDYGGFNNEGKPDIRRWGVFIDTYLDAVKLARFIIDYDLAAGTVDTWKGADDFRTSTIESWFEWFFTDGPADAIQIITRNAVRQSIIERKEMLESIDYSPHFSS
jgi:hypothetical protein